MPTRHNLSAATFKRTGDVEEPRTGKGTYIMDMDAMWSFHISIANYLQLFLEAECSCRQKEYCSSVLRVQGTMSRLQLPQEFMMTASDF